MHPKQRAELQLLDVATGAPTVRYTSRTLHFEAPNWSPDGGNLIINGGGKLFRLPVHADGHRGADSADNGAGLEEIDLGGIAGINNDHVISPDGGTAYVSSDDGHIYAVDLAGVDAATQRATAGQAPRRVTNDNGPNFRHYLHGVSPDGTTLAYIGLEVNGGQVCTNVYTIPAVGGPDRQLTNDRFPDDGAEFSPDGQWIYFNSERGSSKPGHAQLFRMPAGGGEPEQLTFDERVNWFPHPSPDGTRIAYVSFPPGTLGHPADVPVVVRLLEADGSIRDLARVFGGQGTMNVPSWSPDGRRIAMVAYPMEKATE
ncbi:Tol biopolymer transport system component [Arthrobacter stackebrandtii]|uniref:Tol biopolymer transport system component n=1 Tax=Arthrobacter stackebrandtii TaxID=272161 RepID=A0ABS4YUG2_9MICC|nr:PQQ-binding-like beta-propeller repeat protein [Arthrobacter stackebrandtii]MBP2412245.1 Tol biopolymer transport system component [Arthrobacter stackebrandtii]PYH02029.1 biopolymer transporter Tol [Arthrobacter stackebrandtii]